MRLLDTAIDRENATASTRLVVSESTLLQRINRKLAGAKETLKKCPEQSYAIKDLGQFYTVSSRNYITQKNVDIEALGREIGALKPFEKLQQPATPIKPHREIRPSLTPANWF